MKSDGVSAMVTGTFACVGLYSPCKYANYLEATLL